MEIGHERLVKLVERLLGGEILLPDIQRDYVWYGSRIPRLLDSLYREWPVGSILLWKTRLDIPIKSTAITQGTPIGVQPAILLDGQQRMTTLARVMAPDRLPSGQKPPDIRFHPELREFRTANAVQAKDPGWLSVTAILEEGAQFFELLAPLNLADAQKFRWYEVISDMAKKIRDYHLPVQTISVDDYETVADIFTRVNTGGQKLSKGDLIMGTLAARWPAKPASDDHLAVKGGRQEIEEFDEALARKNWNINREVLLRITSVLTLGSANHTRLLELKTAEEWQQGWTRTVAAVNHAVGFFKNDAGIPVLSLPPTQYVLVLPAVFLERTRGAFASPTEREQLKRWALLASAFGHYSGSVETRLAADINTWSDTNATDALARLIIGAQEPRTPGTALKTDDVRGKTRKSPFLRLVQIAAIANDAKTWWSHRSITYDPDSRGMAVEIHHIFPRNWLKKQGLADHPELDTLANFAFLSKHDNIKVSDDDPAEYLQRADEAELRSQWIPTDPSLWRAEKFSDFCAARRELLTEVLNRLLSLTEAAAEPQPLDADEAPEPEVGAWADDLEERLEEAA